MDNVGQKIYELADELFPINRSLTGDGVRTTLKRLQEINPELNICEIPTGTEVFDWTIPKEWEMKEGYIEDEEGNRILDYADTNLSVLGYSTPVDRWVDLPELKKYIYVEENQPEAIPYVTSYYKERYGFCMSKNQKDSLKDGKYHMVINSKLKEGSLTYGELYIPGELEQEILFSTYVCHPSMANNELSGPCVSTYLAKWIKELKNRKYSYRILFLPETIGSIAYLSKHLECMKKNVIAGYVISCVGDDRTYSYLQSIKGDTLADRAIQNVLMYHYPNFKKYSFLDRGSDERQYNSVGVELPVCTFCRSKFGEYDEYHTSLDNMALISPEGLQGSYDVLRNTIILLENNGFYKMKCFGEPQLGKRGLYPTISQKGSYDNVKAMMNFIAYANGKRDLIEISNLIGVASEHLLEVIDKLKQNDILEIKEG